MHDDREIIAGLKNEKDQSLAFNKLVSKYKERLYWHIRKIVINHDDADDVLQNTLIKVWKNTDRFREDSGLYTWLYRIATNEAITHLNQAKKHSLLGLSEVHEYLLNALHADPYFDGDEVQLRLQEIIAGLPEKQRLVFNMRYFDDINYQDMSEILETSVGALKASYHHAVKKIEEQLKKED